MISFMTFVLIIAFAVYRAEEVQTYAKINIFKQELNGLRLTRKTLDISICEYC